MDPVGTSAARATGDRRQHQRAAARRQRRGTGRRPGGRPGRREPGDIGTTSRRVSGRGAWRVLGWMMATGSYLADHSALIGGTIRFPLRPPSQRCLQGEAPWPAPRTPTAPRRAAGPVSSSAPPRAPLDQIDDDGQDATAAASRSPPACGACSRCPTSATTCGHSRTCWSTRPKLWIPFGMLLVSFVLAVLLTQGTTNARWHGRSPAASSRAGSRASCRCTSS